DTAWRLEVGEATASVETKPVATLERREPAAQQECGRRLVIVDGDPDVGDTLAMLLEMVGKRAEPRPTLAELPLEVLRPGKGVPERECHWLPAESHALQPRRAHSVGAPWRDLERIRPSVHRLLDVCHDKCNLHDRSAKDPLDGHEPPRSAASMSS